jgi:hypothetical protein
MKKLRFKIILPTAILAVGVYLYLTSGTSNTELVQRLFGGRQLFDFFVASQQVTAQRVHWRSDYKISADELSNYNRQKTVPVSSSQAARLKRLLQKSCSYYQGSNVKSCLPDYGVVLTFRSGQHAVQVAICFQCNMLGIFDGGDDDARRVNSISDFDPMRGSLVSIIKKIFPDDSEIQDLK